MVAERDLEIEEMKEVASKKLVGVPARRQRAACALVAASATFAGSTGFAATADSATSGSTPRSYDGLWSASVVTEKGDCDRAYRYPIRIAKGVLLNGRECAVRVGAGHTYEQGRSI